MRRNLNKRRRILDVGAKLLAEQGFEGMTLVGLSKASGAAVGSIVHFFGDKAGLAKAIADDLGERLAADARRALQAAHGQDVTAAVGALLSAVLQWPRKFPDHQRLIAMVAAITPQSRGGIDQRLGQVLAEWAAPLIQAGAIARLSPSQLYAVTLAPAICAQLAAMPAEGNRHKLPAEWVEVLTAAALAGLSPAGASNGARRGAPGKAQDRKKQLALSV